LVQIYDLIDDVEDLIKGTVILVDDIGTPGDLCHQLHSAVVHYPRYSASNLLQLKRPSTMP